MPDKLCSIEGCGKKVGSRGWCETHYYRWRRHGDPLGGGTRFGEPLQYYADVVAKYDGDDCVLWPYATNGNGYGQIGRKYVHRLSCELANGPAPSSKHEAAHSCGNGHLGCVTKRHLLWKTRSQNHRDKLIHGTHNRGERHPCAKLTTGDVMEIIALKGAMPHAEIAKLFGINPRHVSRIQLGRNWGWLSNV